MCVYKMNCKLIWFADNHSVCSTEMLSSVSIVLLLSVSSVYKEMRYVCQDGEKSCQSLVKLANTMPGTSDSCCLCLPT